MPLRDHFRSPQIDHRCWDGLHGAWPTLIVMALNRSLPPEYVAAPRVHLSHEFEVDVATREALDVATDVPEQDEYAVFVRDVTQQRRLVAAVEIVSPANKDRPEHRRSFVTKCAALLQQGVSVSIVDLVTSRHANLYDDLLTHVGQTDPTLSPDPPPIYAAACRWRPQGGRDADRWRLKAWAHSLEVGRPLPTLPLWLAEDLAVPLDLESAYEEACRALRIT